jgi:hypothetical protein
MTVGCEVFLRHDVFEERRPVLWNAEGKESASQLSLKLYMKLVNDSFLEKE